MSVDRPLIAVLDDYQGVSELYADWTAVRQRADLSVFREPIPASAVVDEIQQYDALCLMRERTALTRDMLGRLPRLKLIVSTGPNNASIDLQAAQDFGIRLENTRGSLTAPTELTWALILASTRHLTAEVSALRHGAWQTTVGDELAGRTLGLLGLGRIGSRIAEIGRAFGMTVIAWSDHLQESAAARVGASAVSKDELLARSDIVSIHLVLADTTRNLLGQRELELMKSTAWLVNTSRGAIVNEDALVAALRASVIAGAALDVFETEPLPPNHPFRTLPNVVATPHLGYVSRQQFQVYYGDTVRAVERWLDDMSAADQDTTS